MPERSRPDSRHGISKSKFDRNSRNAMMFLYNLRPSIGEGKRKRKEY
jgi:hypothetical protein